jgi:hypothetical protein
VKIIVQLIVVLLISLAATSPHPLQAEETWTPPVEISEDQFGWFPDLAADHEGTVHIIWGSGALAPDAANSSDPDASLDLLRYRALRNGVWTPMNDVAFTCTGGYTVRNSLVVNADGRLQALVRTCFEVSTMSVPVDQAWSALSWSAPQSLGSSYYNALAADSQGRLHALYQDLIFSEPGQPNLASEIFYRRSEDGGQSWSVRTNLTNLPGGDERMQIKVDQRDRIHVVWDHGSDWYLGIDRPDYGIYRRSDDGGENWQPKILLGIAGEPIAQNTIGVNLDGNPLVVYRSATSGQVFFQYSPDGGDTWSAAELLAGVQARDVLELGLDHYSMAVDSANRIHLLMVGFPEGSRASIPMLLHLVWDGQRWSEPTIIAQGPNYPMWPRVTIAQGNQLHAVWFTYTETSGWGERRVWHSSKQLDSPFVAPPAPISLPAAAAPLSVVDSSTELPLEIQPPPATAAQPTSFGNLPPPGPMGAQSDLVGIVLALTVVLGLLGIVTLFTLWRRAQL